MGGKPRAFPLPTEVKIKGLVWSIHYVDRNDPKLLDVADKDEELMGCCIEQERAIYVDRTLAPESLRDTLVHELVHAAYRTYSGLPETDRGEEAVVKFTTETMWVIADALKLW